MKNKNQSKRKRGADVGCTDGLDIIPEIQRLQSIDRRKVVKMPDSIWKLNDKATRKSITMTELRKIIEGERRAQVEYNGLDGESNHARQMLEMVWQIANDYEERYDV